MLIQWKLTHLVSLTGDQISFSTVIPLVCAIINTVPGVVGNLDCAVSSSPSELSFSWELPTLLGNEVVSYQVIVNRLEHRSGSRDVVQSSVYNKFVDVREASVTGFGKDLL